MGDVLTPGRGGGGTRVRRYARMEGTSVAIDVSRLPDDPPPPDVWQERAACFGVDPDIFFPASEDDADQALAYCASCTTRDMCLAWALKNRERYGVWGGMTEQQRRRLLASVA